MDRQQTVGEARFECPILVEYARAECEHTEQVACYVKKRLLAGTQDLATCKVVVSDYIHPICNHRFAKPECYKKREYQKTAPQCEKIDVEAFKRPCGCLVPNMPCFKRMKEVGMPSVCRNSVEVARPRCGHRLSLTCFSARKLLASWAEQRGQSAVDGKFEQTLCVFKRSKGR